MVVSPTPGNWRASRSSVRRFSAQICASSTVPWRPALSVSAAVAFRPATSAMAVMASATSTSTSVKPRVRCVMAQPW